jgi:hypothetical protein
VSDLDLAIEHYRLQFPTLASLGGNNPPIHWKAEYDRVASTGLASTLVTSTGADGSSVGAQRNFDQRILLRALHERRAQLDSTYVPFAPTKPRQSLGIRVTVQ